MPSTRKSKAPKTTESPQSAALAALIAKLPLPDDGSDKPTLYMFAGVNGSGKSTLFRLWDAEGMYFINADELQKIFHAAPGPELLAQKVSDLFREHFISQAVSFATETVFSDPEGAKLDYLRRAQKLGYRVCLIYVVLASDQLSNLRVQHRVLNGGHSVPLDKLPRRYAQSMANAKEALTFVDVGIVIDNSFALDSTHAVNHAFRPVAVTHCGNVTSSAENIPSYCQALLPTAAKKKRDKSSKPSGRSAKK